MKEALFYSKGIENKITCELCPHNCIIHEGKRGKCGIRINNDGILYSEVYGRPVAINTDPIEKKPLYHFYPGYQVLSIGTLGCNMKCSFCQNCEMSQASGEDQSSGLTKSINEILIHALEKQRNIGLAYTYNEPIIYYEYMMDLAIEIHKLGLKNIMVSNGFINPEPLLQLLKYIDAFNIDLKSFDDNFYIKYTRSNLEPVKNTIKTIFASGKHLELTFLVIPGLNDSFELFEDMTDWIVKETSNKTVLHISRYFPRYKFRIPPTPIKFLEGLHHRAKKKLDFVYMGNVTETNGHDTFCPVCQNLSIHRSGYSTKNVGLNEQGSCVKCNENVIKYMTL